MIVAVLVGVADSKAPRFQGIEGHSKMHIFIYHHTYRPMAGSIAFRYSVFFFSDWCSHLVLRASILTNTQVTKSITIMVNTYIIINHVKPRAFYVHVCVGRPSTPWNTLLLLLVSACGPHFGHTFQARAGSVSCGGGL